ncbi:hypothetical protein IWW48_001179 [Coemansia sp. RSA 1200]|nr:hypothetical protein IWW48_001179 [Coemansia sp. RSA 1200]
MNAAKLSNEQLAFVAARTFGKLWMPRSTRESLLPFQTFCYELLRSTQIAVPIVMLTLLYVHKFKQRFPGLHGGSGSEYRVFVVALMLASKYLEDNTFTTLTWSEVSHLPARELIIMQREFLIALDHRLHVPEPEFNTWINRLQTIIVGEPLNAEKGSGFSLIAPQVSTEAYSPSDFQVVPSPTQALHHEISPVDLMPSPPAKRTRPSLPSIACPKYYVPGSGSGLHATRPRTMLDSINVPTYPASASSQMYTPPTDGVGFAYSEFTFKAPPFSLVGYPPPSTGGMFFNAAIQQQQQQQQAVYGSNVISQLSAISGISSANMASCETTSGTYPAYHSISVPAPNVPSLAFSRGDRLALHGAGHHSSAIQQQQQQQQQFCDMRANVNRNIPYNVGFVDSMSKVAAAPSILRNNSGHGFVQQPQPPQQQQSASVSATAFAAQYPSLYYNTAPQSLGLGSGAHPFPIYTYGA